MTSLQTREKELLTQQGFISGQLELLRAHEISKAHIFPAAFHGSMFDTSRYQHCALSRSTFKSPCIPSMKALHSCSVLGYMIETEMITMKLPQRIHNVIKAMLANSYDVPCKFCGMVRIK